MKTLDPRIMRTIPNYIEKQREEMAPYFGPGDNSILVCFLLQQVLGRGEVFKTVEHDNHGIIRLDWAGVALDCDLFADLVGHKARRVRVDYADSLYEDLIPLPTHRLMDADFDRLEAAVTASGADGYASMLPQLKKLRATVRKQRETLA